MAVDLTKYMANLKKMGAYIKEPANPTPSFGSAGPARGAPGVTTPNTGVSSPSGGAAVPGSSAYSSGYAQAIGAARQVQPFTQPTFTPAPPNNNPAPANYSATGYDKVKSSPQAAPIPGYAGGINYGTADTIGKKSIIDNLNRIKSDPNYVSSETQRALGVIKDMKSKGLDTSEQDKYLYGALGYKDAATATATDTPATPAPDDYQWITDMVNNELSTQKSAIEQELARLKQESELAVNQNNTFLQDNIKKLEQNRVQVGNDIVNFQNRRGSFYSGGVDYQTAHNNDSFAQAEGSVTKDIAARNADIWGRNNLLAQQATENLAKLTAQAPDRIRQLIEEQKSKDAAAALDQSKFALDQNKFALDAQGQAFDQNVTTQELGLKAHAQDMNDAEILAKLTGHLPDGTPTSDYQQQILDNAWKVISQIGVVPPELAHIVGVPAGTKTIDAVQIAIQQQNANTSAYSASTARMKADKPSKPSTPKPAKYSYKNDPDFKQDYLDASNDAGFADHFNNNAQSYMDKYGIDGYNALKSAIPKPKG